MGSMENELAAMAEVLHTLRGAGGARIGFASPAELAASVLPERDLPAPEGSEPPPDEPANPAPVTTPLLVRVGLQLAGLEPLVGALAAHGLELRQVEGPALPLEAGDYRQLMVLGQEVWAEAVVPIDALLELVRAPGVLSIEPSSVGVTHG